MLNSEEKKQFEQFKKAGIFKSEIEFEQILKKENEKRIEQERESAKGFMKTLVKPNVIKK